MDLLESLAKNANTFTVEDIINTMDIQREVLWVVLSRLEKKGWIERIEKGKYLIIPLGAEKGKYTIHEYIIGSLLINPYCIAYWSALNHYGYTEQIPQTVFIQSTSRKKRQDIEIFGIRYRIVRLKNEKFFGMRKEWIEDTQVNITDKEKTLVDCLDKPQFCGGIIEVAKGLKNKDYDKNKLIRYAKRIGNSAVMRRLGYLNEFLSLGLRVLKSDAHNYLFLDPTMPQKGTRSSDWKLIVNLRDNDLEKLK
ncbi:MAG: type IV toxin-antitoxin system AbiEi family antitoxin domain-containing protein [Methanomassiliicoccales archaeon]|nr:MAG: type IV toxin-antitoxin system AbiEi family antitoxin domain-containing protein [Methanomassiliicoccales archaeon]